MLIHDNATPRLANVTKNSLWKFKLELWEHTPYKPCLSYCGFHIFGTIQNEQLKIQYQSKHEVKDVIHEWRS